MFDLGKIDKAIRDVSNSQPAIHHRNGAGTFEFKLCQPDFTVSKAKGGLKMGKCDNAAN